MPPLTLDGKTLGEKHKHHNKLVQDAIANKQYDLRDVGDEGSDIDNLLKIDIASKTRNVDYIIQVMKSNDMLYAATAIKKSRWLITEPQYANIINPEYLHTQLLPSMNTKTFNKLMLHIRLNLKDEKRVETFYEYLKETDGAYKWLQNCSIPFIENVIKNERLIPLSLFKRLCRRSAHFIEYYKRIELSSRHEMKKEMLFLLKSNTADVLNVFEDKKIYNGNLKMGKKKTKIVMKTCPERILDNFEVYYDIVNLSEFAKYLKKKDIKSFLQKQVKTLSYHLAVTNSLKDFVGTFVNNMPEEERFEFIKKTFIEKTAISLLLTDEERRMFEQTINPYQWYEYAPFTVALPELQKLICKESSPSQRFAMLSVLLTCAKQNPKHIKTLLNFVTEKHINEPFLFKIEFVNNLLSKISTHEFDVETWNVLDQLFHSMEVYTESDHNVQMCLQSIILYKVLHDEPIPEIIHQKITFSTFKKFQSRLNQEQKNKIFTHLLSIIVDKIQSEKIPNESNFHDSITQITNALILLRNWKKEINAYPFILEKIHELIKMKQENSWDLDVSCLYFTKKSWRKHMFQDSLSICLNEDTCLNALKHDPQLLTRHDKEIESLRTNHSLSLRRLLGKLRVYWPHSLAQHWTDAYLQNLDKPTEQKAVIKGLFLLFSQEQIVDMAKKHAPYDPKVIWGETDQTEIRIRKNIAKHLYLARPMIPLDTVLLFAKGDYLQHAVPSLDAILYNCSEIESRKYLPKLLDAPVSLQKFGLHLAFLKLKADDLKSIFSRIWDTTKNNSIKAILFKHTYDRMCKVKNPTDVRKLWELLTIFIDWLDKFDKTGTNPQIFKKMGSLEKVPISVRAEYYMKSYEFLASLPDSANCEKFVKDLIQYAPTIIELLEDDFIAETLLSPAKHKFLMFESDFIEIFACYVLLGESEEDQLKRFRRVMSPALEEAFQCWGNIRFRAFYVKNNFDTFLKSLVWNFRIYFSLNKIAIPAKLFGEIKNTMVNKLPLSENYVLITSWKLITEYVTLMDEHASLFDVFDSTKFSESDHKNRWMSNEMEAFWKDIHVTISPFFGPALVKCLKEDVDYYSPTIHSLFTEALEKTFDVLSLATYDLRLETLKHMLNDDKCISSYIVVSKTVPKYCTDELKSIRSEIRNRIKSHHSMIVQVHYFNDIRDAPED